MGLTWTSRPGEAHGQAGQTQGAGAMGGLPGWGQKAVLGHTSEVFRLASQLELKAAPCLVCLSILTRAEQPSRAPWKTGGQRGRETEAVFKAAAMSLYS